VATGQAFVGNVHAVDRLIWTALGNTTNLASRLQSLTRDLDAAMIIDEATWRRAGADAELFRPAPGTEIRGRKEHENLYLLPLPA
jgi:adenylate cyclase